MELWGGGGGDGGVGRYGELLLGKGIRFADWICHENTCEIMKRLSFVTVTGRLGVCTTPPITGQVLQDLM